MSAVSCRRRRAYSLRRQLFNKHLFEMFNSNSDEEIVGGLHVAEKDDGSFDLVEDADDITGEDMEDIEAEYEEMDDEGKQTLFTTMMDILLDRRRVIRGKTGRQIPVALDHQNTDYWRYVYQNGDLLMDERSKRPYVDNRIASCEYASARISATFLLVTVLPLIPRWPSIGNGTGLCKTIIPLCLFIMISMIREAMEDLRKHRIDREENYQTAKVLRKNIRKRDYHNANETRCKFGARRAPLDTRFHNFELLSEKHGVNIELINWKDLRVGDFVLLNQNDWVPADLLLLTTDGDNNECFVETVALDGENSLTMKRSNVQLSRLAGAASGLANMNTKVVVEDPNNDLYSFEGSMILECTQTGETIKYPLNLDNVLFRGSLLRNTQNVAGMVMFTGEETKIRMDILKNSKGKSHRKINSMVIFMAIFVTAMSL